MSQTSNIAAVLHGAADLRIEEHPISAPAAGEVQIAVKSTGLCGSDLHYYIHGRNGEYVLRHPMALGHESSGVVTAVGDDAGSFKVGDRVAIEAGINCAHCRYCQLGRYNLCKNMRFASSAKVYPHQHGTLQTLVNHPVRRLHHLADNVSFEEAALAEPLAVALQAASRANITAGQTVLIYGAGAVGLLVAAVARAFGATEIAIVDINGDRVDFAVKEGFVNSGHTLPRGPRPETPEDGLAAAKKTADEVLAATSKQNDDGFDVVLECTGVQTCMQASIHSARPGGKVVFIGMGTPNALLPVSAAAFREVDMLGVFRYANRYPDALALFSSGLLPNVHKLVTTRLELKDAVKAFELLKKGVDDDGKLVLKLMVNASE